MRAALVGATRITYLATTFALLLNDWAHHAAGACGDGSEALFRSLTCTTGNLARRRPRKRRLPRLLARLVHVRASHVALRAGSAGLLKSIMADSLKKMASMIK
jgi:hypothetical protein